MAEKRRRTISATELADETGTTVDHIAEIVASGALREVRPGRHEPADIPRVETVLRLEEAGIGLDVFASSMVNRFADLEYIGRYYLPPAPRSERTYAAFRESFGARAGLLAPVYAALGLPEPADDARLRLDEETAIADFLGAWALAGDGQEPYVRAARLVGEGIRRMVDGWTALWGEVVYQPLVAEQGYNRELSTALGEGSTRLAEMFPPFIVWLQQRHTMHAINELNVGSFEEALEREGLRPPRPVDPPAVGFVDLTGFTSLTEAAGDELAVRSAAMLQELADEVARRYKGRLVKLLGDGAMLSFPDAAAAVPAIVQLMAAIEAAGLPPGHAGIAAGPVVERDGDIFGRTVNLAARISSRARAGQVLVSQSVVEGWATNGVRFDPVGDAELKGIPGPVPLFLAVVSGPAGGA